MRKAMTHAFYPESKREATNSVKCHRLDLLPQADPGFCKPRSWEER